VQKNKKEAVHEEGPEPAAQRWSGKDTVYSRKKIMFADAAQIKFLCAIIKTAANFFSKNLTKDTYLFLAWIVKTCSKKVFTRARM
jgi:hypothetical protein